MATNSLIVIGTYEGYLCGYEIHDNAPKRVFRLQAHQNCINCVATCDKWIVSGGNDDTIRIFHAQKRIDHGTLYQHNDSVTHLAFYESSYLLSGSADGTILIWRCRDWTLLHTLNTHQPVSALGIHPSGKLVLSATRKAQQLSLWNLLNGRLALQYPCNVNLTAIHWSPNGLRYGVISTPQVIIYSQETCEQLVAFEHETKVHSCCYFGNDHVLTGDEAGKLHLWSIASGTEVCSEKSHTNRIRAVVMIDEAHCMTASSDHSLKYWHVSLAQLTLIETYQKFTDRVTCMASQFIES